MTAEQLKPVFEKKYNRAEWQNILRKNFNVSTLLDKPVDITRRIRANPYDARAWELGSFTTTDGHLVGIYEVEVKEKSDITRNRKGLRNLLAQVYSTDVEAALLVFIQGNKWRFTYVSEITVKNKETGKREKKATDPKRFTYLLGEGERAKTAADRFAGIKKSEDLFGGGITLDALEEAFNVEKMSKAFFNEYRKQYGQFVAHITGEDENGKKIRNASPFLKSTFNGDHKAARDFVKKMLGRIVFLYFLEKKGWLGVPRDGKWGDGDDNFLSNLFRHSKDKKIFYSNVLVPLFFATLNTERKDDYFKIDDRLFTQSGYSKLKIPYLNGGLFEEDETTTQFLVFPEELFKNLFTFFDQYNFTVYEDSPDEHTVAVDPEILGHIFENLLEDNKDKGAFYTPKEIVHYMCQESLIEYLCTKLALGISMKEESQARITIENFVLRHEAKDVIEYDELILTALKEVKICDPAIGSGAFPMGLLMEIFHLVETLHDANPDLTERVWQLKKGWNPAQVKESIIQNSIYGVDIEKGAVDIARLRFWLSLVVDEDTPKPLPNLDYKIVVGNSLLSKFDEEVIEIDWDIKSKNVSAVEKIINDQQTKLHLLQSRQHLYFVAKGNKAKLQKEIRDLKIDVLVNQLTLSKISFKDGNPRLGGFAPTPKEIMKNLQNELKLAGYDKTIQRLQGIKKDGNAILHFFDWKLDFPEVMNEKVAKGDVGFDIVIANPPYISNWQMSETRRNEVLLLDNKFGDYLIGHWDIFICFLPLSLALLKSKGLFNFILPTSFYKEKHSSKMRHFLVENFTIIELLDFDEEVIFENVARQTGIIRVKKEISKGNKIRLKHGINSNAEYVYQTFFKDLKGTAFKLDVDSNDITIYKKINNNSSLLGNYVCINTGVVAHSKIDSPIKFTKDDVISNKKKKDFKPYVIGSNLAPYFIGFDGHYIDYNSKKEYFHRPKFPLLFETEKIIVRRISGENNRFVASYDNKGYYSNDNLMHVKLWSKELLEYQSPEKKWRTVLDSNLSLLYILGVLNSNLTTYYFRKFLSTDTLQGSYSSIYPEDIRQIPIKVDSSKYQKQIENIVSKILIKKQVKPEANTKDLERNLDFITYKLYGLTYKEACIVEGNMEWMIKEEYEAFKIEN